MSEDDDLLREASDPTTPGERLAEILSDAAGSPSVSPPARDKWRGPPPGRQPLRAAVLCNPSLPLAVVRGVLLLRQEHMRPMALDAWHNPVVPLLLQSEPVPEYHEAARRLLATLTPHRVPSTSLGSLIQEWSREDAPGHPVAPHREGVRALARHLAGLFGLPWPEEP